MTIDKEMQPGTAFVGKSRSRAPSLFGQCLILLLAMGFQASAQTPAAPEKLTKLDPEPVVVHLENGRGTADVFFILAEGIQRPTYEVTSATGDSNTIPASDITFQWVEKPKTGPVSQSAAQQGLLAGRLTVTAHVNVEPDRNYLGRVIFYLGKTDKPVTLNFAASDRTTLAFTVAPPKLDLTFVQFQPDTLLLRIKNTGRAPIRKLHVSSSDLIDGETQRRLLVIEPRQEVDFGSTPLAPGHEGDFSFRVPQPHWAGTYTGTADIVANDFSRQSISFTVRSRGPLPARNAYWVPFVLFVVTLLLGYLLSHLMENWFNLGGLQRAEAQLSLQKSERELTRIAEQVETWKTSHATAFAQTTIRLQHDLHELRELFRRILDLTREELVAEAKRFTATATVAGIFESAVNVALKQWPNPSPKLDAVLTALDRETPGADPVAYRARLRAILEAEAQPDPADPNSRAFAFDARAALPDIPLPADLEKRIKLMAHLQRAVAAAVVFIMAYQLFYARDFAFGTLLDYLGVFLWSLGLTQMGTQLIARARSSQTPIP